VTALNGAGSAGVALAVTAQLALFEIPHETIDDVFHGRLRYSSGQGGVNPHPKAAID
jgi:hypothetical protein